jgi:hypothetical protein
MKALRWILDHWYIPLFAIGVLLGWWLTRGKQSPFAQVQNELEAIEAGRKARELEAKIGARQAAAEVVREHAEAIQRLDGEDAKKAEELRHDPAALSKFLVRAGRSR